MYRRVDLECAKCKASIATQYPELRRLNRLDNSGLLDETQLVDCFRDTQIGRGFRYALRKVLRYKV